MSKRTMIHLALVIALAIAALLLIRLHSAAARTPDPHRIYERSCARCHQPHASGLAREHLRLDGSEVRTKGDGREIGKLLANHARLKLAPADIEALVKHFGAMLGTGWLFQDRCFNCHGPAAVFARTTLKLAGTAIVSKSSGRDMAEFLQRHGDVTTVEQRTIIIEMLRRQLETAN